MSAPALPIDYFALGDSVASGYGLADDETVCRQSPHAYPWRVFEQLQGAFDVPRFELLACSGTTTGTLDSQVSEVLGLLSKRPTLITLTVGANDSGWSDLFPFAQHLCSPDEDAFHDWVDGITHTIEDNLVIQLGRLVVYPNVEVVLTNYYNPTNTSGAFWELVNPRCLFVNVYNRTEYLVHTLNASLTGAWQRLGSPSAVHIATVHAAFHGHEAPRPPCGTVPPEIEETWIQYPGDPDSNATPVGGDCFHPNRMGAAAYAESVLAVVPPDLALPLRLSVNDSGVRTGETLTLTMTITPEPAPMVVDLYVGLQVPDQSLWFLQADGSLRPEVRPLVSGWTVAPFRGEVFRYTLTGEESPGSYRWLASPSRGRGRSSEVLRKPRLPSTHRRLSARRLTFAPIAAAGPSGCLVKNVTRLSPQQACSHVPMHGQTGDAFYNQRRRPALLPGELARMHYDILFLDGRPEFRRYVLCG